MQTDGVEIENRLHCKKCNMTLSRSDSFKRHLQSERHLACMRGEVQKAKLGRPTKDAAKKKAEQREKKARKR